MSDPGQEASARPEAGQAQSAWLSVTPWDTVFIRDGRAFDAASDAIADTVRPSPTTIAGTIGAAYGGHNPLAVRGPVLAWRHGRQWIPYFPVPADLVEAADGPGRVYRLGLGSTGEAELDLNPDGLRFLVPPQAAEFAKPLTGWIPGDVLARYLAGELPGPDGMDKEGLRLEDPLVPERRVGLARDDRAAREGYLYQATHLRPRDGWGFLAECDIPAEWGRKPSRQGPFGGRGRLADIEAAVAQWPQVTAPRGRNVLVYLATPAVWTGGWRPPAQAGARLIAAATREPEPAATVRREQDQWRASRVLRWAVPAGSVYWLRFDEADEGARWASKWHGKAIDRGVRDDPDLVRTAGFGVVLTGAWT